MAVQYAVAFSSRVMGVASIAGGPYNCANAEFGNTTACMTGNPSAALSWQTAQELADLNQLDPLAGISKQRVYIFHGTRDITVKAPAAQATREFFKDAGVTAMKVVSNIPAGHAFVSASFGNPCDKTEPPYIVRCSAGGHTYDQPKELLQWIYGPLKKPANSPSSNARPFDQREFASAATSLDSIGFVYIPTSCEATGAGCKVHVVFHGCFQGAESVGPDVYKSAGFNRWADTNGIIVLYPQIKISQLSPFNPDGCWDWWGGPPIALYTGPTFMVRSGVQLSIVKAMVDRLTQP